jgi:hypothetical protein
MLPDHQRGRDALKSGVTWHARTLRHARPQNLLLELFVFFFFLGKLEFSPAKVASQLRSVSFSQALYPLLSSPRSNFFSVMPISNGDAMIDTTANALDYTKALEVLKNEYQERDGIDVKTLIDSKKNGGLTYNDFLMLPGYIGA